MPRAADSSRELRSRPRTPCAPTLPVTENNIFYLGNSHGPDTAGTQGSQNAGSAPVGWHSQHRHQQPPAPYGRASQHTPQLTLGIAFSCPKTATSGGSAQACPSGSTHRHPGSRRGEEGGTVGAAWEHWAPHRRNAPAKGAQPLQVLVLSQPPPPASSAPIDRSWERLQHRGRGPAGRQHRGHPRGTGTHGRVPIRGASEAGCAPQLPAPRSALQYSGKSRCWRNGRWETGPTRASAAGTPRFGSLTLCKPQPPLRCNPPPRPQLSPIIAAWLIVLARAR